MKKIVFYSAFILLVFTLSCKSKVPLGQVSLSKITVDELVYKCNNVSFKGDNIYFKRCDFSYELNGKGQSANGSLFIKFDSCIVVSVQALLGIEVARIKITPSEVYVLDRFHKQVIVSSYSKFTDRFAKGVNYKVLQSILCNRLFNMNSLSDTSFSVSDFKVEYLPTGYGLRSVEPKNFLWMQTGPKPRYLQEFLIEPLDYNLVKTTLVKSDIGSSLTVDYSAFTTFGGFKIPLGIEGSAKYNADMIYFKIHSGSAQINVANGINFNIPEGYEKVVK